jgi:sigma-B regulation protein RsbU (phosphoserine phosphatase)
MFVTMIVGVYDPRQHRVRLANAGHLPVMRIGRDGRCRSFAAEDPPLGVQCRLEHSRYHEIELSLRGARLYLYSDGATEAHRADGSAVGFDGLRDLLVREGHRPAGERLRAVAAAIDGDAEELRDDLTLLVVEAPERPKRAVKPARRRNPNLLVEQTLPAQPQQLKIVRRLVVAAARAAGAPGAWAQEFALAVDEACQNIIRHGYHACPDGRIELRIRQGSRSLTAELVDFAPRVAEDRCQGRSLDEVRPGGLGTHFMRMLTDRVQRRRPPPGAGNRLLLVKHLPEGAGERGPTSTNQTRRR